MSMNDTTFLKVLSQWLHTYGVSPECYHTWVFRYAAERRVYLYNSSESGGESRVRGSGGAAAVVWSDSGTITIYV